MKALILVAGASLALAACTEGERVETAQSICPKAVAVAQSLEAVAQIAEAHGVAPDKAHELAVRAFQGENVVSLICQLSQSHLPGDGTVTNVP